MLHEHPDKVESQQVRALPIVSNLNEYERKKGVPMLPVAEKSLIMVVSVVADDMHKEEGQRQGRITKLDSKSGAR